MRHAVPLILLAMLGAAGCGKQTADQWLKAKMFPPTPAERVLQLESPQADVRREAVLAIEARPETHSIPSVVKLMCLLARGDADPMVRASASRTLGVMKGDAVIPTLSQVVRRDRDDFVRTDAAQALGRQGSPEGLDALIEVLQKDRDVDVRVAAAEALRFVKDVRAAEALVGGLEGTDIAIARKCWESLRYMTGQPLPCRGEPWRTFLASSDRPFAAYGKVPAAPRAASQRPQFTQGVGEFFGGLFRTDRNEAELH